MSKPLISDDGRESKYFTLIVNMADDDLDPYQYRLYGHYKRICGDNDDGACWESTRTTAKKCKMSIGKVAKTRRELVDLGYIEITTSGGDQVLAVTLKDLMHINVLRYLKRSPNGDSVHLVNETVHTVNGSVHEVNETVHQVKQRRTKEEEHNEEDKAAATRTESNGNGAHSDEQLPDTPRIFEVFVDNMRQQITPLIADAIKDAVKDFGEQWVEDAIKEAVLNNAKNWKYVAAILNRWGKEGRAPKPKAVKSESVPVPRYDRPEDNPPIDLNEMVRQMTAAGENDASWLPPLRSEVEAKAREEKQ